MNEQTPAGTPWPNPNKSFEWVNAAFFIGLTLWLTAVAVMLPLWLMFGGR